MTKKINIPVVLLIVVIGLFSFLGYYLPCTGQSGLPFKTKSIGDYEKDIKPKHAFGLHCWVQFDSTSCSLFGYSDKILYEVQDIQTYPPQVYFLLDSFEYVPSSFVHHYKYCNRKPE